MTLCRSDRTDVRRQIGQHPEPAGAGERRRRTSPSCGLPRRPAERIRCSHRAPKARRARRRFGEAAEWRSRVVGCESRLTTCGETVDPKLELFRPGPIRAASGAEGLTGGSASWSTSPSGEEDRWHLRKAGSHAALRRRHRPREASRASPISIGAAT
jgi:hypothetical protein